MGRGKVHKDRQGAGDARSNLNRVLSLTLDEWKPEVAALMKLLGNRMVNSIYENYRTDELETPKFDSSM